MKQRNPVTHRRKPIRASVPGVESVAPILARDPWARDVADGLRALELADGRPVRLPGEAVQELAREAGRSWRAWEDMRAMPKRRPLSIVERKTRAITSAAKELSRSLDAAIETDVRLYREIAHEFEDTDLSGAVEAHGIHLKTLHRAVRMLADITEKRAVHYEAHKGGQPAPTWNKYRDVFAQRIVAILEAHGIAPSSTTPTSGAGYGGPLHSVASLLFEKCGAGTPNADLLAKAIRAVRKSSRKLAGGASSS